MNTEQVARELRQVTDERDRGTLSLTDYRRRRAELLDHLVGLQPRKDLDTTRPRAVSLPHARRRHPQRPPLRMLPRVSRRPRSRR